ncbi:kinase-like domain-containing protein [Gloeopeniophorella convolvens]|nr:kinase-like domain-containing protein [Gloeopeniophorella convolvens]
MAVNPPPPPPTVEVHPMDSDADSRLSGPVYTPSTRETLSSHDPPMTLDDFEVVRFLGGGTSGTVHLVKEKSSGILYALKTMPKVDGRNVDRVFAERNALLLFQGEERIMQLHASFHDSENFYLVMEYLPAGDLFNLLYTHGDFSRDDAKLYAAELLLAIESIHKRGVIHRDLKPENIMIAMDGHLVIGDFGLAWKLQEGSDLPSACVGTPEYCAPEVLLQKEYGMEVDLWSFGVILYELLGHHLPFEVFLNLPRRDPRWIECMADHVAFDSLEFRCFSYSHDAKDLLRKLLAKRRSHRLISIPEIKKHRFFSTIDWDSLAKRSRSSPWKPHLIPPMPGSIPLQPSSPQSAHSAPYTPEEDPYPEFALHIVSPRSSTAASCMMDTSLRLTWEKAHTCETCVNRCRLGHIHGPEMDGKTRSGRGWVRHVLHLDRA